VARAPGPRLFYGAVALAHAVHWVVWFDRDKRLCVFWSGPLKPHTSRAFPEYTEGKEDRQFESPSLLQRGTSAPFKFIG